MQNGYRSALMIFSIVILFFTPVAYSEDDLPEELKDIPFRDGFFESQFNEVGNIASITGTGKLVVLRRAIGEAFFAKETDPVYENDALYTLQDCRCRIIFKDKNVAMLAQNSHLGIDEVFADVRESRKDSLFSMAKGKAIFYVLKLFSYRDMNLRLKTPTAVIGVRGTKFGSEIEKIDMGGYHAKFNMVAGLSDLIAQSETVDSLTRVYVLEGEVEVTSLIDRSVKQVRINEILEAGAVGLGDVIFDPQRVKAFTEEVIPESVPGSTPEPEIDDRQIFQQQELDRREELEDIRQKETEPQIEVDEHPHHYE